MASRRGSGRILAVDGGDSKTDVVLLDSSGNVLVAKRVRTSGHAGLDRVGAQAALDRAIALTCAAAGVNSSARPVAELGVYCLAGADLPVDERRIHRSLSTRRWTTRTLVRNDTLAVLRAGTDRGWGVAIVCGSGMNAAGLAPDGRVVRFPAFGEVSGDLAAGGGWIGLMGLAYAVRAEDGRGKATVLQRSVPRFFRMPTASAVTESLYLGRLPHHRLVDLAPIVFQAARERDRVSREILDRVADEIIAFAVAAIKRLRLQRLDVEVVLGGGIFRSKDRNFHDRIRRGIEAVAPRAILRRLDAPPVVGAALIGLDVATAPPTAQRLLRQTLTYRVLASTVNGHKTSYRHA